MSHWRDCEINAKNTQGGGMRTVGEVNGKANRAPEHALLSAVLTRAVQDARGAPPIQRREARQWLRDETEAEWSFRWIVAQLGWPACTRWRIWRYVNSPDAPDIRGAPIKAVKA